MCVLRAGTASYKTAQPSKSQNSTTAHAVTSWTGVFLLTILLLFKLETKKHVVNACVPASVAGRAAPRTLHASAAVSLLDFTAESCRCFVSAGFSVNHCRVALGRDVSCTLLGGRWPARAPDRTEECGLWDEFTAWLWCGVAGRGPGRLLWS